MDGWADAFYEIGAIATQHDSEDIVPLALSYAKVLKLPFFILSKKIRSEIMIFLKPCMQTTKYSHILALSNEEGFISLFDTSRKFPSPTCYERNAGLF